MTQRTLMIALPPGDINEFAKAVGISLTLVPGEKYVITKCNECSKECWIGPSQLELYQTHDGPAALLCYRCIIASPHFLGMMDLRSPNPARVSWLP